MAGQYKGTIAEKEGASGKSGLDGFSIAQLATDVGAPLLYELFTGPARRQAKEDSHVDLTVPELWLVLYVICQLLALHCHPNL